MTDIRNFERFIPERTINAWYAEKESCRFKVSMLGEVNVRLIEKEKYNKVVYSGDALRKNDFLLTINISDNDERPADVQLMLSADLNPMMKMIASKPIEQFLEILIKEMETFCGWKEIRE